MVHFCCVNGCKKEWYPGCGLTFHRIPKDEQIAEKWMIKIPGKVTNTSVVCSLHFKDDDYVNESRKKLKPNTVPSIFKIIRPTAVIYKLSSITLKSPEKKEVPQSISEAPCSSGPPEKKARREESEKSTQTNLNTNTPRKRKLKREIKVLSLRLVRRNTTIKNLKSLLAMIKKRCDNYPEVEETIKLNFENIHEKINTAKSSRSARYSDELKSFALTLYYYSGKAYSFLRNHVALPHPATLRRLLATHNCNVGFMTEVFGFLKNKADRTKYFNVALIFDSMSIKTGKSYDAKNYKMWGGIDFGGIIPTDAEKLASEVLVFTIVSLKEKFKCPIAYFFVDKISANIQAQLVSTALRMLADINVTVRCLTSDGATANFKTYEILGCDFYNPDIKSFFKHPSKGTKVHCIFDPVHMLKTARYVFAETSLSSEKGEIKFEYVKKLQKLQEEEGLKLANKISRSHVNFFGKKMNVRLAARLNVFQETREYLAKLKVNGQDILKHRRKTPALGLIIDTFSISNLAIDLFKESSLKYFLAHKISQDHLELFFSCVRACGRTNDNPDALHFMYTMRKLLFRNSVRPSINANCSDEDYDSSPILEFRSAKRSSSPLPTCNRL